MSHGGELFAIGESVVAEPGFDIALRGYERRQVDRYVAQVEAEVAALAGERDEAYVQVQALAAQVHDVQNQMAELRRQTAMDTTVTFRHLGPRVEHILALAEEQAEAIRAGAVAHVERERAEAHRVLEEARERANQAIRDFEMALDGRRKEEERAAIARRDAVSAEVAEAEAYAQRLRAEAEQYANHVRAETQRVSELTREDAARTAAAELAKARESAHTEVKAAQVAAQVELERARSEAERLRTETGTAEPPATADTAEDNTAEPKATDAKHPEVNGESSGDKNRSNGSHGPTGAIADGHRRDQAKIGVEAD